MAANYRVTVADAFSAHERALTFGGRDGVTDERLIEAAVFRPYSGYYRTIARKASALTESVACNHGFVDGNKRTALYLVDLLPTKSGYGLVSIGPQNVEVELEEMILATVRHELTFEERVLWFKCRLRCRPARTS